MRLEPERSVLLIIDIQERLAQAMKPEIMEKTTRNVSILLEAARRLGVPVVVSEQYPKGLGPTCAAVNDALATGAVERFEKVDFSVCRVDAFEALRKRHEEEGRTQWLLAGMETHICVYQSARDLMAHSAEVQVVSDAAISRSSQNYRVGLGLIERCGAAVTSTETVVMDLLGRAQGDDFKAISRLIR